MRIRNVAGIALVALSVFSVVQTGREVWQSYGSDWTESQISDSQFTFAGRTITIVKPPYSAAAAKRNEPVQRERVRIDGVDVSAATGMRMSTWPFQPHRRSPHWMTVMTFVDNATGDSSLLIARRLQAADTVRPQFEIITIDGTGKYGVQMRTADELRGDYRLNAVTYLVAESTVSEFPLSLASFIWFPYLLLVFPIGTGLLGVALLWSSRTRPARQFAGA